MALNLPVFLDLRQPTIPCCAESCAASLPAQQITQSVQPVTVPLHTAAIKVSTCAHLRLSSSFAECLCSRNTSYAPWHSNGSLVVKRSQVLMAISHASLAA